MKIFEISFPDENSYWKHSQMKLLKIFPDENIGDN